MACLWKHKILFVAQLDLEVFFKFIFGLSSAKK